MQADGQDDSHAPFSQIMLPGPKGSGSHPPPGAQGQPNVPSAYASTKRHTSSFIVSTKGLAALVPGAAHEWLFGHETAKRVINPIGFELASGARSKAQVRQSWR